MAGPLLDAVPDIRKVFSRLPYQLFAVRKDERAPMAGDIGKGYGLPEARRHLHKVGARVLRLNRVYTFCLIIPQFYVQIASASFIMWDMR